MLLLLVNYESFNKINVLMRFSWKKVWNVLEFDLILSLFLIILIF